MMSKVKATKTSKIQSVFQDFLQEFINSSNNELYFTIRAAVWFLATSAILSKVIETQQNTKKH